MKHILISIKPKYVAEILNHRKTLEIRKSFPKCELPCEVYIYCTKGRGNLVLGDTSPLSVEEEYAITRGWSREEADQIFGLLNGLVVAKFTLKKITPIGKDMFGYCPFTKEFLDGEWLGKGSCLTQNDLRKYLGDKTGYAWHIDQKSLVIFDKPKELKEFGVKRSPQSWQFVEVNE